MEDDKQDIFVRTCYRIIYVRSCIKQFKDNLTNKSLYQLTGQIPLCETMRERQLKFTGSCIRMPTDEPAYCFFIYESRIRSSLRPGVSKKTFLDQKSSQILPSGEKFLEENQIGKMVVNKSKIFPSLRKSLLTDLLSPNDDADDDYLNLQK